MTDITYARVVDGVVNGDPITLPDDVKLGVDLFTPDEAPLYHPCDATVRDGWTYDGKTFAAPAPVVAPEVTRTLFAPRDFMALFTSAEQTAIFKARQTSVDVDMFITLAMAGDVDVTNTEVVTDINSLVSANLLTADRAKQILAGQAVTA